MRIGADGASQPQRRGVGAPLGITELAARGLAAIAVRPRSEALAPRAHRGPRWVAAARRRAGLLFGADALLTPEAGRDGGSRKAADQTEIRCVI